MFSKIKKDINWYTIDFPLIKRTFDSIFLNYKWVNLNFWNLFNDVYFEKSLFWISKINNFFLFYYLDLENFIDKEFILSDFEKINVTIFDEKYSIFLLYLINWEIVILNNYKENDFDFFIEQNIFKVKNKELNSIIFEKNLKLNNFSTEEFSHINKLKVENNYTSILDIYFFRNFFIKSKYIIDFNFGIQNYLIKNITLENKFFPNNILSIFEKGNIKSRKSFIEKIFNFNKKNKYKDLKILKKFLLFKNRYDFLIDSIYYEDLNLFLKDFFFLDKNNNKNLDFEDINKFKINLEEIDNNLLSINSQIHNFMINYYNLEKNYEKINKLNNENKSLKILEQNKRLELFKINLEKIKKEYLKYFRNFLSQLEKYNNEI